MLTPTKPPRVFLTSLGCRLNQSELETWKRSLAAAGCQLVDGPAKADLCIVNSCTVTHVAARKSRQLARRCHTLNASAQVLLTGCYAQMSPDQAQRLDGITLVLGNQDKEDLVQRALQMLGLPQPRAVATSVPTSSLRTRALVKIQDGCDNACSYCIVRVARGSQKSRALTEVVREVEARSNEGYQEIVLTGVHIGAYGRDSGESLDSLVRAILSDTPVLRLRLSSIEPWDVKPSFLHLWQDHRLCRHLHLPLQSGCDATLHRMNRHYTTAEYEGLVQEARARIPGLAVTTDVIVGFPGEDAGEFEQSASFVRGLSFARLHVFPYSPRPGTPASTMSLQVSPKVKQLRAQDMQMIGRQSSEQYRGRFLDCVLPVLWETCRSGVWTGFTDNYLRVETRSQLSLHNRIVDTRLLKLTEQGLYGALMA